MIGIVIIVGVDGLFEGKLNPNNELEGIWKYFYIYLLLLGAIPVLQCTMLFFIWRQREEIAAKIRDIIREKADLYVSSGSNLNSEFGHFSSDDEKNKFINATLANTIIDNPSKFNRDSNETEYQFYNRDRNVTQPSSRDKYSRLKD